MWVDNETDIDLLGFRIHVDLIRSIITDKKLLPTTIGIFGDWGGGKTSVMKMLQKDLDPELYPKNSDEYNNYNQLACIYFNGWLFEGYDDAKSALLSSVLTQLSEHKKFGPKIKDKIGSLLSSIDWMRLAKFSLSNIAIPIATTAITGGGSLLPAIFGVGNNITQNMIDDPSSEQIIKSPGKVNNSNQNEEESISDRVRSFRDNFEKLLRDTKIDNLVVLIDDLDRCSPERIIENLEAIKLFLNVPGSAFVIGADPRIVRHAVATILPPIEIEESTNSTSNTDIINDYLEKFIQVPYTLPRLSPAEVESYMSLLFCQKHLSDEDFQVVVKEAIEFRKLNRYSVFGKGAIDSIDTISINDSLDRSLVFCNQGAPMITEGLKGNPRQIKRFLNAYWLRSRLAEVAKLTEIKSDILVKLMILEYTKPRQFEQLFKWQASQSGVPKEISDMESITENPERVESGIKEINSEWDNDYILRWLQIEPKIANVDLRDYFWVARDKLRTTLSGISMVPPLVRKAFEDLISKDSNKNNKSFKTIDSFDDLELGYLFGLFEHQILKEPEDLNSFKVLVALCEKNISQSLNVLSELLLKAPAIKLDPSLGIILLRLIESNPSHYKQLQEVVEKLRKTETRIAAALQPRQKVGK